MGGYKRYEMIDYTPYYSFKQTSILTPPKTLLLFPDLLEDDELELLNFPPTRSSLFDHFDTITDLIQLEQAPFHASASRLVPRRSGLATQLYLQSLSDRVEALELGFDRLVEKEKEKDKAKKMVEEKKYTWTAEFKSGEKEKKYKWVAEKKGLDKSFKWTAEVKGKGHEGPIERTYTVKVSNAGAKGKEEKKMKKKEEKKVGSTTRIVEIEEPADHGVVVLRQAFAKRVEKSKGKRKELSPLDAAILIQMTFRAYLIRRSKALRALRELAIAKTKLKEIRGLFNNFSYRRLVARDAEERQRFSEKIIVLLLTVDAIEGADQMVRAAKKSMVDELEAMLDVVDPQPPGKSLSMRRRKFDMPDGIIDKELAAGVAQVVQMLDQEANGSDTFEACL